MTPKQMLLKSRSKGVPLSKVGERMLWLAQLTDHQAGIILANAMLRNGVKLVPSHD